MTSLRIGHGYDIHRIVSGRPMVLGGVVLAMTLLGLVATWIPARRALLVDPLVLLREE